MFLSAVTRSNFSPVVPALNTDSGIEFVGKPAEYSRQVRDAWTNTIYHSPQDEVQDDWDLGGLVEDLELLWTVGDRVAQADAYPKWSPGTEFEAIRERTLSGR